LLCSLLHSLVTSSLSINKLCISNELWHHCKWICVGFAHCWSCYDLHWFSRLENSKALIMRTQVIRIVRMSAWLFISDDAQEGVTFTSEGWNYLSWKQQVALKRRVSVTMLLGLTYHKFWMLYWFVRNLVTFLVRFCIKP
jgi:hypothetical protein